MSLVTILINREINETPRYIRVKYRRFGELYLAYCNDPEFIKYQDIFDDISGKDIFEKNIPNTDNYGIQDQGPMGIEFIIELGII